MWVFKHYSIVNLIYPKQLGWSKDVENDQWRKLLTYYSSISEALVVKMIPSWWNDKNSDWWNHNMFLSLGQVYDCWLIYKFINIITKLKINLFWKLFTKVIMRPSEGSLGLDRQSVLIKREAQALLI